MYKDKKTVKVNISGIGFFGILGVAFIILKLCKIVTWPWIWVLAPIWGSILLWLIIVIAAVIFITR